MTNDEIIEKICQEFDEYFFDFGYHERGGIEVRATGKHICGPSCRPRVFRNFSRKNVKVFLRSSLESAIAKALQKRGVKEE